MAICSGCSADVCSCALQISNPDPSLTLSLSGTGQSGDPWILSGVANVNACPEYITVSASNAFASSADIYRDCADFQCDGVDDQIEIQAAIDASFAQAGLGNVPPVVLLLPGAYLLSAPIDTKSITLKGLGQATTLLATPEAIGGVGGNRLIDNTASSGSIYIEWLSFYAGGAAAIYSNAGFGVIQMQNCGLLNTSDSGVDGAFLFMASASLGFIRDCEFSCVTSTGTHDNIHIAQAGNIDISHNHFFGGAVFLENFQQSVFSDNYMNNIYTAGGVVPPYALGLTGAGFNMIANNNILTVQRNGIVLTDCTGNNLIGNNVHGYAFSGSLVEDGIQIAGTSSENNVQLNRVRQVTAAGRNGINVIGAAAQNNLVTNNDLFNSGAGASFADTGTATIMAAGNRL